ncbi:Nif3-like dinuclear metal center hexameric protein [Candidatus Parcubacteria bacterium]|nr:MAG: Nif3-like dinuclear metal center hexameric protein [Candidatus Parcubacteria bacterium]
MATNKQIVEFCQTYLESDKFKDYCLNGLQVEGKSEVRKIVVGVSLSVAFIKEALEAKADMLVVHHGIFGNQLGEFPQLAVKGYIRQRLKLLLEHNLNLVGFHLPLDAHPKIGNNISLLKILGLKKSGILSAPSYGNIGFVGTTPSLKREEFISLVEKKLNTKCYWVGGGPRIVKRVGIVSGGASNAFQLAKEAGVDTFLCGEIKESVVRAVEELQINFINAGHYNTEKLGIQNLGRLIGRRFKVKVEFIDIPNEV